MNIAPEPADETAMWDSEIAPEPTIAEVEEIEMDSKPFPQEQEVSFEIPEYTQVLPLLSYIDRD